MNEPNAFYFYTSLEGERKAWIREILIQRMVYFRSRDDLNDPAELRPRSVLVGSDADKRAYFARLVKQYSVGLSPAKRVLAAARLFRRYQQSGMPADLLHGELKKVGVLSLSESLTENLLWSHYASGHRGIAIEFDASVGLFVTAQQVQYAATEPVINRLADDGGELLEKSVLTKSVDWQYEREWRVIARPQKPEATELTNLPEDVEKFLASQHGPGHYSIPERSVRSVTLGSRCCEEDEKWLRSVLAEASALVVLQRANFSFGSVTIGQLPSS